MPIQFSLTLKSNYSNFVSCFMCMLHIKRHIKYTNDKSTTMMSGENFVFIFPFFKGCIEVFVPTDTDTDIRVKM